MDAKSRPPNKQIPKTRGELIMIIPQLYSDNDSDNYPENFLITLTSSDLAEAGCRIRASPNNPYANRRDDLRLRFMGIEVSELILAYALLENLNSEFTISEPDVESIYLDMVGIPEHLLASTKEAITYIKDELQLDNACDFIYWLGDLDGVDPDKANPEFVDVASKHIEALVYGYLADKYGVEVEDKVWEQYSDVEFSR